MTEFNHLLGPKSRSIISDDIPRTAKSREDVSLNEFHDERVIGLPRRDGFYPFGKVFCCCENTFMLGR